MKTVIYLFLFVALLAGGCTKNNSGNPAPDPNAPILDAEQTGWERVARVPLSTPPGNGFANSMTAHDLQLSGSELRVLYEELRSLSGGMPEMYKATAPAGGAATVAPLRFTVRQRAVGTTTDYYNFFFFKPGSYEAYHGLNTFPSGNLSVATSQVFTETGQPYQTGPLPCHLNGNGGTFSGAAPRMLADGSVLYSQGRTGGSGNGTYWWQWLAHYKNGVWLRAMSQGLSAYTPHTTTAFEAVQMPNGRFYGAVQAYERVAIADTGRRNTPGSQPLLPALAAGTFAGHQGSEHDNVVTKIVGNTILFAVWNPRAEPIKFSAYRWTQGSTVVEQLYANAALPISSRIRSECQLDENGAVGFFATNATPSGLPGMALMRADQRGVLPLSKPVNLKDFYAFSCPRYLNGQWYAALGPTTLLTGPGPRNLDLVRLRP